MAIQFLREAVDDTRLYHFTSLLSLANIIKNDRLGVLPSEVKELKKMKLDMMHNGWDGDMSLGAMSSIRSDISADVEPNRVSFTRDPRHKFSRHSMTVVVDKSKLIQRYKVQPYRNQASGFDEAEEVVKSVIKNVGRYMVELRIPREDWDYLEMEEDMRAAHADEPQQYEGDPTEHMGPLEKAMWDMKLSDIRKYCSSHSIKLVIR
ncbi:hypothetical protein SP15_261 [Bacillus phage SP-15]|uniref:Uncharacterized protein n=1 Tax=Bacillus phage SP-15 TaxID=1792032 RepID=A0A127AWN0_9CAUD|nr:hypothetical protein SP15_261 [Bacillus phage SP-15]AMM45068.1 hypothetical protein SP15_261 [Bacillus phage SP-15]